MVSLLGKWFRRISARPMLRRMAFGLTRPLQPRRLQSTVDSLCFRAEIASYINIFIFRNHYERIREDVHMAAIHKQDPKAFQKVPGVDPFMIAHALQEQGGIVVSNDQFRDHVKSKLVT